MGGRNRTRNKLAHPFMAVPEHVEVVRRGASAIYDWRLQRPGVPLNLSGADLSGLELRGADLSRSILMGTSLRDTSLEYGSLAGSLVVGTDALGARMSGLDLAQAVVIEADFSAVNLSKAELFNASVSRTTFHGAKLGNVVLGNTVMAQLDLGNVSGLESVHHFTESVVDTQTLMYSLRGLEGDHLLNAKRFFVRAGVSKEIIELLADEANAQHSRSIIRYLQRDDVFARRLRHDLENRGIACALVPFQLDVYANVV